MGLHYSTRNGYSIKWILRLLDTEKPDLPKHGTTNKCWPHENYKGTWLLLYHNVPAFSISSLCISSSLATHSNPNVVTLFGKQVSVGEN